jgi:hypothetical protein
MVLMRDAVARRGGELPAADERLRACGGGSFRRIWTAAVRLRPPRAGAGQDRGAPWTQMHRRVVWPGLDGQDAIIGAAPPGAAAVLTGPLGAQMLLAATGSNRAA